MAQVENGDKKQEEKVTTPVEEAPKKEEPSKEEPPKAEVSKEEPPKEEAPKEEEEEKKEEAVPDPEAPKKAAEAYDNGLQKFRSDDYNEAATLFGNAVQILSSAKNPPAYTLGKYNCKYGESLIRYIQAYGHQEEAEDQTAAATTTTNTATTATDNGNVLDNLLVVDDTPLVADKTKSESAPEPPKPAEKEEKKVEEEAANDKDGDVVMSEAAAAPPAAATAPAPPEPNAEASKKEASAATKEQEEEEEEKKKDGKEEIEEDEKKVDGDEGGGATMDDLINNAMGNLERLIPKRHHQDERCVAWEALELARSYFEEVISKMDKNEYKDGEDKPEHVTDAMSWLSDVFVLLGEHQMEEGEMENGFAEITKGVNVVLDCIKRVEDGKDDKKTRFTFLRDLSGHYFMLGLCAGYCDQFEDGFKAYYSAIGCYLELTNKLLKENNGSSCVVPEDMFKDESKVVQSLTKAQTSFPQLEGLATNNLIIQDLFNKINELKQEEKSFNDEEQYIDDGEEEEEEEEETTASASAPAQEEKQQTDNKVDEKTKPKETTEQNKDTPSAVAAEEEKKSGDTKENNGSIINSNTNTNNNESDKMQEDQKDGSDANSPQPTTTSSSAASDGKQDQSLTRLAGKKRSFSAAELDADSSIEPATKKLRISSPIKPVQEGVSKSETNNGGGGGEAASKIQQQVATS